MQIQSELGLSVRALMIMSLARSKSPVFVLKESMSPGDMGAVSLLHEDGWIVPFSNAAEQEYVMIQPTQKGRDLLKALDEL